MAEHRKIRWTPAQRQIYGYLKDGYRVNDVVAKGHGRSNVERVNREIKLGKGPPDLSPAPVPPGEPITRTSTPTASKEEPETRVRIRTLNPVEVGGLFIEPADWRINQYGGFLILNTHAYARERFDYSGTVGDFLCDAVQVMRQLMGLDIMSFDYLNKEDHDNGGGESEDGGEGSNILGEIGGDNEPAEAS